MIWGAGLTHVGRVRERNEDALLTDPGGVLWAVADGMGGYGHGDMASDMVIDSLAGLADDALAASALRVKLQEANGAILARAAAPELGKMGATVVAAMIQNGVATIAWVGDCRAYLWRSRALRLLTRDHTVVQEMIDDGVLRAGERETHPESHVVTRAVGVDAVLEVEVTAVPLVAKDRILMCSDGLTACLGDGDIRAVMEGNDAPETLCRSAVTMALERGAPDNVSVVAIFCEEPAP